MNLLCQNVILFSSFFNWSENLDCNDLKTRYSESNYKLEWLTLVLTLVKKF